MGRHTEGLHTRSWRDLGNKEAEMELRLRSGQGFTSRKEGGVCSRQRAKAQRRERAWGLGKQSPFVHSFIHNIFTVCLALS